jgi:hypothetical protein
MRVSCVFFCAAAAFAQNTGTIAGTITDADGRAVAKTPVQAANTTTHTVYKAATSDKGEYALALLPAGTYELSVPASVIDFKPYVALNIAVQSGQTVRHDIRLQEGIALNTLGDGRDFFDEFLKKPPPPDGPAPRLADGKPDLSGYWETRGLSGADPSEQEEKPDWLPAAEAFAKAQRENEYRDFPSARCLSGGVAGNANQGKFVHTPALLVILLEGDLPRQIYLDGRGHPRDLNPSWMGHSVGRWEGDTLVVDSVGFNDKNWLDFEAHPQTERLHIVERYRRPDLGHLELEMTIEDPGVLKKPWTMRKTSTLDPKGDILEYLCTENNRDLQHLVGK